MTAGEYTKKQAYAWSMYDWANSAFSLSIMCAFFPEFFKKFWGVHLDVTTSTAYLGYGNAAAGFFVAILSPVLGALAGTGRRKKNFLGVCAIIGIVATASLFFVSQGLWLVALVLYVLAAIGFSGANLFYDAMLVDVAAPEDMDQVSSLGFGLGYIGSSLLFIVSMVMIQKPQIFGLASKTEAVRLTFILVAVWWAVFSVPLVTMVKERVGNTIHATGQSLQNSFSRLGATFKHIRSSKAILFFLVAYWCYMDGINAFITMAYDFGLSIGISSSWLMISLLAVQLVAFPSSIGFGKMAKKIGTVQTIFCGLVIYIIIATFGAFFIKTPVHYLVLAALTGVAQGGIQALSRSHFAKMVEADHSSDYFGFYNLTGKFSVIVGPALVASVALLLRHGGINAVQSARFGMSSVSVLFVAGAVFLALSVKKDL